VIVIALAFHQSQKFSAMEDNVMTEAVLTVEEAARYLKVSKVTIRRWCAERKLPAFKIGREWRINKSELDKMMQSDVGGVWGENVVLRAGDT